MDNTIQQLDDQIIWIEREKLLNLLGHVCFKKNIFTFSGSGAHFPLLKRVFSWTLNDFSLADRFQNEPDM